MNEDLNNVYHRILFDKNAPDEAPDQAAREQLQKEFRGKRRRLMWIAWGFIAFELTQMALFATVYLLASNTKLLIALAALIIMAHEGSILMKIWYWVVHTRLLLVREVKELRLEVAELAARSKSAEE